MTRYQFGLLTSLYAPGGLLGSLIAGTLADQLGRKRASLTASAAVGVGSLMMAFAAPHLWILLLGRFAIGIGCGIVVVIVPNYLSEIAPADKRGSVGVLNQLGIVTGIFVGQAVSIALASPSLWRFVPIVSACIAAAQGILSPKMVESPVWLAEQAGGDGAQTDETSRLLADGTLRTDEESIASAQSTSKAPPKTMRGALTSPLTRKGLRIVLITQIFQQISGINAVLYYSSDIMKHVFPTKAGYIALMITGVNFLMTFPPLYLIDRVGRRPLLLTSIGLMSLFSLSLSFSITSHAILSSFFIMAFVAAFSIGNGPIPFILIPEVVPPASAPSVGSIGLSVNWIANFIVGSAFLPLASALGTQGVMLMFAAISAVGFLVVGRVYQP